MAQPASGPVSGDSISQVESDITQTFNLAGVLYTAIQVPLASLYNDYQKRQTIKQNLGCWHKEALNKDRTYRSPVIRREKLETYLVKQDGELYPGKNLEANSSWGLGFCLHLVLSPEWRLWNGSQLEKHSWTRRLEELSWKWTAPPSATS